MAATLVRSNIAKAAGSGTTLGVSLTGIAAASAMGLIASYDTTSGDNTDSIADDLAVAATRITAAGTSAGGFNQRIQSYYYKNYGGGTRTFTLTNSAAETNRCIVAGEVAGADTANPLDGVIASIGSTTLESSGNVVPSPTVNGCIIFGGGNLNTGSTVNAPFADLQVDSTVSFTWTSFLQQAVAAAVAATWTQSTGLAWQAIAFVLKPASVATSNTGRPSVHAPGRHVGRMQPAKAPPAGFVGGATPSPSFQSRGLSMAGTRQGPLSNRFMRSPRATFIPAVGGNTFTQALDGGLTPIGDLVKQTNKVLTGVLTPAGTLVKLTLRALGGGMTPSGALTRQANLVADGAIAPAGGLGNRTNKGLSAGMTPAGAIAKQTQIPFGGGLTPAGTLAALHLIFASLSGALGPSGVLSPLYQAGGGVVARALLHYRDLRQRKTQRRRYL